MTEKVLLLTFSVNHSPSLGVSLVSRPTIPRHTEQRYCVSEIENSVVDRVTPPIRCVLIENARGTPPTTHDRLTERLLVSATAQRLATSKLESDCSEATHVDRYKLRGTHRTFYGRVDPDTRCSGALNPRDLELFAGIAYNGPTIGFPEDRHH